VNVSVIVASYGDHRWRDLALERAVASVADQPAAEIIAYHDDAATLAEVRNTAAAGASGDWLCFLDADDRLGTGYLDAMSAAVTLRSRDRDPIFPTTDDGAAYSALLVPAVQYVDAAGRCQGKPEIPSWGRPLRELNCAVIGTLVPRALFEQVGGFHDWPLYEDWELWLRCQQAGARLVPVPDAVYCAHVAGDGGRNQPDRPTQVRVYGEIRALYGEQQ
jgi:glycosyltransferase involved in cell wall biosynthesis